MHSVGILTERLYHDIVHLTASLINNTQNKSYNACNDNIECPEMVLHVTVGEVAIVLLSLPCSQGT